ncbi:MAG: hypothetical protein ACWGPN_11650, partial [Gammaproteobacteria bacterium]
ACMAASALISVPNTSAQAWRGELPIAQPWIRTQLPPGTLAYQRIPYPLALLAMPKGNMLDEALMTDANVRNLVSIQEGLADKLGGTLTVPFAPLLLDHLRSPVELAVSGLPMPAALIGATLDLRSAAELEMLIGEMSTEVPIGLVAPLDDNGFGQLTGLPLPAFVHFDADSGRLAIYGGQVATLASFAALLEPSAAGTEHPMHALESEIDSSGQGYFGWIDAMQALQLGAMMMPPETMTQLRTFGLDRMRALAFGAGVANGKGRLKVLADLGPGFATRPLPVVDNRITATSVGEPRSLFLLSLPSPAEFERIKALALEAQTEDVRNEWAAMEQRFSAATNTTIAQILSAVGPEIMAISDEAGDYVALRVRDRELLDDVLNRLSGASGIAIEERSVARETIRYISVPSRLGIVQQTEPEAPSPLADVLARLRTRIYWTTDGDYLYLAGVPQLLIERARLGADTSIATWLDQTQRVDLRTSLLAGTGSVPRIPGLMYQAYLNMMQSLADIAEVEYDVWTMPTASQLDLPERGTLGFSINLGDPIVSLEMTYESHPAEFLFGAGGVASIAAAGVLAGITVPAYQDYIRRAQAAAAAVAEAESNDGTDAGAGADPNVESDDDVDANNTNVDANTNVDGDTDN